VVGKTLGPYKIIEQLGKGGMGEVWLAEDTRLERTVAVKVLPAELAGDVDRRQRFEQEAKAAAALNHPNIAAIHDVGVETTGDGPATHYMVQEHLQGETLKDALSRGPLPYDKALTLAIEIGEGLKAAHRAGIVHRRARQGARLRSGQADRVRLAVGRRPLPVADDDDGRSGDGNRGLHGAGAGAR